MAQRQDVAALLDRARTALTNAATDPDLSPLLASYGYDAARLGDGRALADALEATSAAQQAEYGDKAAATQAARLATKAARALYMRAVKLARIEFAADAGRRLALGLAGKRPRTIAAFLDAARTFYANALADPDTVTGLAGVATDATVLQGGLDAVRAAEAARAAQASETGQAQQATVARDASLAALRAWFGRFVRIAEVATEGQPELRERLGLLERS